MTDQQDDWLEYLRKKDSELLRACRVDVYKATGKGGQKKNKTSNAIRLTLGKLTSTESKSRSKSENIAGALKKLRLAIATDFPPPNEASLPSPPVEIQPYLNLAELRMNPKNSTYPIFIGFICRRFQAYEGNWLKLAEELGTSTSQVRKFVERNPNLKRVLTEFKERTKERG